MKVRIASIQYQLRHIDDWDGFARQVDFVLNAAADYCPQFVLLPELFTTQLLSFMDNNDVPSAVRALSEYTTPYIELLRAHAVRHGYYLIGGTHPNIRDAQLLNTAFLFTPGARYISRTRFTARAGRRKSGTATMVTSSTYSRRPTARSPF